MQEIKADRHKNKLYVTFDVSEKIDMQEFIFELQENCYQLTPGFSCIFKLQGNALSTQVDKWMIHCVENLMYEHGLGNIEHLAEDEKGYDSNVKVVYRGTDDLHLSLASVS
jgi:hypothetical protein